jgi:hypothetical protein
MTVWSVTQLSPQGITTLVLASLPKRKLREACETVMNFSTLGFMLNKV